MRPSPYTSTFLGGPGEAQLGYSNTILDIVFFRGGPVKKNTLYIGNFCLKSEKNWDRKWPPFPPWIFFWKFIYFTETRRLLCGRSNMPFVVLKCPLKPPILCLFWENPRSYYCNKWTGSTFLLYFRKSSLSVRANLSWRSRLLGNLSIVSHRTWALCTHTSQLTCAEAVLFARWG